MIVTLTPQRSDTHTVSYEIVGDEVSITLDGVTTTETFAPQAEDGGWDAAERTNLIDSLACVQHAMCIGGVVSVRLVAYWRKGAPIEPQTFEVDGQWSGTFPPEDDG